MKSFMSILLLLLFCSCGESFLEIRPSVRQRVPGSLADYAGLMDNTAVMNVSSHALGIIGSDEMYLTDQSYETFPSDINNGYQKRAYTWDSRVFEGNESYLLDWNDGYKRILWANLVLEGVPNVTSSSADQAFASEVTGVALFHRAWNYYNLAQLFCGAYDEKTAMHALGLPLRLEPDLTVNIKRSSLSATYQQIIKDLEAAAELLPNNPENTYRPGKAATYGLLSRVYMQMGYYQQAYDYAIRCLAISGDLLDYSSLDLNNTLTFTPRGIGNPEVIFMTTLSGALTIYLRILTNFMLVDSELYSIYDESDIRRDAYFVENNDGHYSYKGSYDASLYSYFTGIATGEIYLIKAECAVRLNDVQNSLDALNKLRRHRFPSDLFEEIVSQNPDEILEIILEERRRELAFRGVRWEDLRRLNKDPKHAKVLSRMVGGNVFTLEPNDSRYVWPLPVEAIRIGGYEQNER